MFLSKRICLLCFKFGIFLFFPGFWLSLFPSLMNVPLMGGTQLGLLLCTGRCCVQPGHGVDSQNLQSSFYLLARSLCVPPTLKWDSSGCMGGGRGPASLAATLLSPFQPIPYPRCAVLDVQLMLCLHPPGIPFGVFFYGNTFLDGASGLGK